MRYGWWRLLWLYFRIGNRPESGGRKILDQPSSTRHHWEKFHPVARPSVHWSMALGRASSERRSPRLDFILFHPWLHSTKTTSWGRVESSYCGKNANDVGGECNWGSSDHPSFRYRLAAGNRLLTSRVTCMRMLEEPTALQQDIGFRISLIYSLHRVQ